jgi:hypothetical protein
MPKIGRRTKRLPVVFSQKEYKELEVVSENLNLSKSRTIRLLIRIEYLKFANQEKIENND